MPNKSVVVDKRTQHLIINFYLPISGLASANLYTPDNVLVTPIFSGKALLMGQNSYRWDKKDFLGNAVAPGTYNIRIDYSNMTEEWEGVMLNSSTQKSGVGKHAGYWFITDVVTWGDKLYYCNFYWEKRPKVYVVDLANVGVTQHALPGYFDSQNTRRICTDGVRLYSSGQGTVGGVNTHFIYAVNLNDYSFANFSAGQPLKLDHNETPTYSAASVQATTEGNEANNYVHDIAVQPTGNYFFESYTNANRIRVYLKVGMAFVADITISAPGRICCDLANNLYVAQGTTVKKYTVAGTGNSLQEVFTISGFASVRDLDANTDTVLVSDGGASQQVKAYRVSDGTSLWVDGDAGGYVNGPDVNDHRFMFNEGSVALQANGTYWVVDDGNFRVQQFNAARTYLDQIAYLTNNRVVTMDKTNHNRVFSKYLEVAIDYTKGLNEPGAWKLKKNWSFYAANYNNPFVELKDVVTLSNGRTYCSTVNTMTNVWEFVELVNNYGIRPTGVTLPENAQLYPDGVYFYNVAGAAGTTYQHFKREIVDFNGAGNPVLGGQILVFSVVKNGLQPLHAGEAGNIGEKIGDLLLTYDATAGKYVFQSQGYHLGGYNPVINKFQFQTAYQTGPEYKGYFIDNERFDNGNFTNYPGSGVRAAGDLMATLQHNEFYNGQGQLVKYKLYNALGAFLKGFGKTYLDDPTNLFPPGIAGNAISFVVHRQGDTMWLFNGDEGFHSGVHRWKVTGLDSIASITLPVTLTDAIASSLNNGRQINLLEGIPIVGGPLVNGTGGWVRSPLLNNSSTGIEINTGYADYEKPNIGFQYFGLPYTTAYAEKPIGLADLDSWRLSFDYINYLSPNRRNNINVNSGGALYQLLDDMGKLIFEMEFRFDGNVADYIPVIAFNRENIYYPPRFRFGLDVFQSVDIAYSGDLLRFVFAHQPPVFVKLMDSTANPKNIGAFRIMLTQNDGYRIVYKGGIRSLNLFVDSDSVVKTSGSIDRYLSHNGIAVTAKAAALKKFEQDIITAGIRDKLDFLSIGEAGLSIRNNLLKIGDSTGYWTNPTQFHMHIYNRYTLPAGDHPAVGLRFEGLDNKALFLCVSDTSFQTNIRNNTSDDFYYATGNPGKLKSLVRMNDKTNFYLDGLLINQRTTTPPAFSNQIQGEVFDAVTTAPTFCMAYGNSAWTVSDEAALLKALQVLKLALINNYTPGSNIEDGTAQVLTSDALNKEYGGVPAGTKIFCAQIGKIYEKKSDTVWLSHTYSVVS